MPIELEPLVLPIDCPTTLVIRGLTPHARYAVRVRSRRQLSPILEREYMADENGSLRLKGSYAMRGEHAIDVQGVDPVPRLHFFVVPPELFTRRPLRCDFHIHTTYSDGDSPPAEMAIRGRELGLDVTVITDHDHYLASLEAVAEVERLGLNLIAGPGEEVSGPNWHILSVNANAGIHDLGVRNRRLEGDRAWEYDALRWAVLATQAHGGRAYLAHPYWAISRGYHLPSPMYDRILAEGILDGIELLGDVMPENNLRSLARYLDFRASGGDIPILSNSDTHGVQHTYGTYWTLVFAEQPTLESVLEAIADGWSVACTTAGRNGESRAQRLWALGTFELVDYTYFLEQQFFPAHDRLCEQEAALAERVWRGETLPAGAIAALKASMDALYARCWADTFPKAARGSH